MRILIIGDRSGTNIGGCFERASNSLNFNARLIEARSAAEAPSWLRHINWRFRGHRPTWLKRFSREILETCYKWRPQYLITTGIAPIAKNVLDEISHLVIRKINYLTDNPWNPSHKAQWFIEGLPLYDDIFSVRRSNLKDLQQLACRRVAYLPFAYEPELHHPDPPKTPAEHTQFDCDISFIGCADRDRVPYITALISSGFRIGLYGAYWERYLVTKTHVKGYADPKTFRKVTSGSKVALCLVRRANRDGNSMRTFEIPAIGACMLTEDTEEHREIFGEEGKAVVYFQTIDEMIEKLRWLLNHPDERTRLAEAAHYLMTQSRHTYKDRLISMLNLSP